MIPGEQGEGHMRGCEKIERQKGDVDHCDGLQYVPMLAMDPGIEGRKGEQDDFLPASTIDLSQVKMLTVPSP